MFSYPFWFLTVFTISWFVLVAEFEFDTTVFVFFFVLFSCEMYKFTFFLLHQWRCLNSVLCACQRKRKKKRQPNNVSNETSNVIVSCSPTPAVIASAQTTFGFRVNCAIDIRITQTIRILSCHIRTYLDVQSQLRLKKTPGMESIRIQCSECIIFRDFLSDRSSGFRSYEYRRDVNSVYIVHHHRMLRAYAYMYNRWEKLYPECLYSVHGINSRCGYVYPHTQRSTDIWSFWFTSLLSWPFGLFLIYNSFNWRVKFRVFGNT